MKTCIILNPKAGSVADVNLLTEKFREFSSSEVRVTEQEDDARKFAAKAVNEGCSLIISAGGDGTLNEVVNGIAEHAGDVRLGIIPLGTGNDFARSHNIPIKIEEAIEVIARGYAKAIDLVRVTSDRVRYFINVSAGGFSGIVDEKLTAEIKKTWGPLAYWRCAAEAWPELRAYEATVTFDDTERISMRLYNVIVGNGRYVAGGIAVAPEAQTDDGELDVILIPERSVAELAVLVAQILIGKHLQSEAIVYRRAKKFAINSSPGMWFNVDGELVGNEPAVFEVMPHALQVILPNE